MTTLVNTIKQNTFTKTENGRTAHRVAGNPLFEMVSKFCAMRNSPEQNIVRMFEDAFEYDPIAALKILFWARDVRGGQGERRVFYVVMQQLMRTDSKVLFAALAHLIPEYGSWRDVRELIKFAVDNDYLLYAQFLQILQGTAVADGNMLAAKWSLDNNDKRQYRAFLANVFEDKAGYLRDVINLRSGTVERAMSENRWEDIDFDKLPSKAGLQYRKAFKRHVAERYEQFLNDVKNGNKTINAKTLMPFDVYKAVSKGGGATCDAMWNALPNFVEEGHNVLCMADVSGSMSGDPMAVSVSLALYTAERLTGPFKDHFMTFSSHPELVEVRGANIAEKMHNISRANWDMSTNIDSAFNLVLNTAKKHKIKQVDMPNIVLIISDMQFDATARNKPHLESLESRYLHEGYEMPHIVYWNVRASIGQPAQNGEHVTLVSGFSPQVLKQVFNVVNGKSTDIVDTIVMNERYDAIERAVMTAIS